MGKRLTVLATALLLVWSMTAAAFAKEPEISVEIDQTGQDSAAAVITLGSEVYTSILVKVPGEPWYDFTWVLEDVKSMTLPVYENGTVQVQATRENGTKATASVNVDCLPEPEPLDCPVESEPEPEPEKEPEQQPTPQKQSTTTTPVTTTPKPEASQNELGAESKPETGLESEAETPELGTGFTGEGNAVTRDLLYDKATNKQFVTLETKDGTVFYLVIDYDSPVNEEEEQYQTYFLNLVDAADLAALVGEEDAEPEEAPPLCNCRERCQVGKIDTTCPVCTADLTACLGEEPEPEPEPEPEVQQPEEEPKEGSSSAVAAVILLLVILVGGAVFVVKLLRRKEKTPSRPPEDDDEDYVVENVEEES